ARSRLAGFGAIADRCIRNRYSRRGCEFEERRIKGKHVFAFSARTFRKDDHAFTCVEPLHDLLTGSRNVATVLPVNENVSHVAYEPAGEEPIVDLGLR